MSTDAESAHPEEDAKPEGGLSSTSDNTSAANDSSDQAYVKRSEVARLWLASLCRCRPPVKHPAWQPCSDAKYVRKSTLGVRLSFQNVHAAGRVLYLTSPRLAEFFLADTGMSVVIWILGQLISGTLPAWRIWSNSRMTNLVQMALKGKRTPILVVLRTAGVSLLFQCSEDIYKMVSKRNEEYVKNLINNRLERAYLDAQLSLSIPSLSDPYMSILLTDASHFAGFRHRSTKDSPFDNFSKIVNLFALVVDIFSQFTILLRAISQSSNEIFGVQSLCLFLLALAPGTLKAITPWLLRRRPSMLIEGRTPHGSLDDGVIRSMASTATFRQEVVLFGLKDWLLEQWDAARVLKSAYGVPGVSVRDFVNLGSTFAQHGFVDLYNILIALQILSSNVSLGSVRLYRKASNQLYLKVKELHNTLSGTLLAVFQFAAFCEATSNVEDSERQCRRPHQAVDEPLIDYDDFRQEGGMRIEAINLCFTYPRSVEQKAYGSPSKAVLHNVNLVVEPGESLAIVGFNGAGKTTLAKVLMGLYNHTGTLLVNGRPIDEYDQKTVHKRTSCLFQDFNQYHMSMRRNVGLGSTARMNDDVKMSLAAERGGLKTLFDSMAARTKEHHEAQEAMLRHRLSQKHQTPPKQQRSRRSLWMYLWILVKRLVYLSSHVESIPAEVVRLWRWYKPISDLKAWPGGGERKAERRIRSREKGDEGSKGREQVKPLPWDPPSPWDRIPTLSGGQWQKVALSRAFLRSDEADLIVFDEPSASLDPKAESDLFQRIHSLSTEGGRKVTTIYISHRFSTVRKADKIAVVEEGTVKEAGTHDQLMALRGLYHELYTLSKEGFDDPVSPTNTTSPPTSPNSASSIGPVTPITPPTPVAPAVESEILNSPSYSAREMVSKTAQTEPDVYVDE